LADHFREPNVESSMSLESATRTRIEQLIASNDVFLFMKGNRDAPQCGFSATVCGILDGLVEDYTTHDVLSDPDVREGIKEFSSWPTIPQLYVRGEFLGGCDIIQEMAGAGELATALGVQAPQLDRPPQITVTERAVQSLREASQGMPEESRLHLGIDARFQNKLFFAPPSDGTIGVEAGGITVYVDGFSAARADGATIDVIDTDQGPGFRIDNPNAPSAEVRQLTVQELKARMDSGAAGLIFDVRTPEERARASLPGTQLLNPDEAERIAALPKDTPLTFHCHHGGRSQAAAEHFAGLGFSEVYNLAGGIEAWSQEIDPEVPRY
jgi:monothiol glutaredoxin